MSGWGWQEWLIVLSLSVLLFDTHKRASRAMDAALRIERLLLDLKIQRDFDLED